MDKRGVVLTALATASVVAVGALSRSGTVAAEPRSAPLSRTGLESTSRGQHLMGPGRRELTGGQGAATSVVEAAAQAVFTVCVLGLGDGTPVRGVHLVLHEPALLPSDTRPGRSPGDLQRGVLTDGSGHGSFGIPTRIPLRLSVRGAEVGVENTALAVAPFVPGEERKVTLVLARVPTLQLRGELIDARSGAPVVGADLRLVRSTGYAPAPTPWSTEEVPVCQSDSQGRFRLTYQDTGALLAQVDAAGYGPTRFWLDGSGTGDLLRIELHRAASLAVEVQREDGGHPARLEIAVATQPGGGQLAGDPATWMRGTDQHGRALLEGLPPNVALTLEVRAEGQLLQRAPEPVVLDIGEQREERLILAPGTVLIGSLKDARGRPRAGHELWLVPAERLAQEGWAGDRAHRSESTDPGGGFSFGRVARGDWWLGPADQVPGTLAQASSVPSQAGRWIRITGDVDTLRVDLGMAPGNLLRGRVLDPRGRPAADALVRSRPLLSDQHAQARSDGEGRFQLGPLPTGLFEVSVPPEAGAGHAGSTPTVFSTGVDKELVIRLRPLACIELSAFGSNSEQPPQLAQVLLSRTDGGPRVVEAQDPDEWWAQSADAATWRCCALPRGQYAAVLYTEDGLAGVARAIDLAGGEALVERTVQLEPGATILLARTQGAPAAHYEVLLGRAVVRRGSLPGGEHVPLLVPAGELRVRWRADSGEPRERQLQLQARGQARLVLGD